jgi:hypothetical protein
VPSGSLSVSPATGTSAVSPNVTTSAACPADATEFFILMKGGAAGFEMPADGQLIQPPNGNAATVAALSTTGVQTQFAFDDVRADAALPAYNQTTGNGGLRGSYSLELSCSDGLFTVGTFIGSVSFTGSAGQPNTYNFVPPAPTATSTSLGVSPASPQPFGSSVTLTATVTPTAATGSVQFKDGGANLGAPVAVSGGTAVLVTSALTVGAHSLTAQFTPTGNFAASISGTQAFTVNPIATTTSLSVAPPSPQDAGASVTLDATVTPSNAPGTVQFKDGGVNVGSPVAVVAGAASLSTTSLGSGARSLTAVFTPANGNYSGSTSPAVAYSIQTPTSVTLGASPASPQLQGTSVTLTATLSPSNATGSVQFKDGGVNVGSPVAVSGGQAVLSTSSLLPGVRTLSAEFTGSGAFKNSTSSNVSYTITTPAPPTTTTLSVSPSSPQVYGTPLTLSATVSPVSAAGQVVFRDGSDVLGTITVSGGSASLGPIPLAPLAVGVRSLSAEFVPADLAAFAGSNDSTTFTILPQPTQTSLAASPVGSANALESVTLTATITPAAPSGSGPGSVVFKDGGSTLGTVAVASGSASLTTAALAVGARSLTAEYLPAAGSPQAGSVSAALPYTVNAIATSTSVVAGTTSPQPFGSPASFTATVTPAAAGQVQFTVDGVDLGTPVTVVGGSAGITTSALAVGARTVAARFIPGSAAYLASTASGVPFTITQAATTTALTVAPAGPLPFGAEYTLTSASTAGVAGSVEFSDGAVALGSSTVDAGGVATLTTTSLSVGSHDLSAAFTPADAVSYSGSTSSVVTREVTKATTTTAIAVAATFACPDDAAKTCAFTDAVVTATVTGGAAGSVQFKDAANNLGSPVAVASGKAQLGASLLVPGPRSLTAVFTPTDPANADGSTSPAQAVTVVIKPSATGADGSTLGDNPSLEPGQTVTVKAEGFEEGESVTPTVRSTPIVLTPVNASTTGAVTYPFTVPAGLEPGVHTLTLAGANGVTSVFTFTVPAAAPPAAGGSTAGAASTSTSTGGSLSATGARVAGPAGVGILLVALGAGLLAVSRRRAQVG